MHPLHSGVFTTWYFPQCSVSPNTSRNVHVSLSWNFLLHTEYCAWKHSVRVLLQKPSLAFHILRKIQYIKDNVMLCEYWQVHGKIDALHSVLSFPDDNILVSSNMAQLVAVKIHHEFTQAGLRGSEVDFDFGLLPGFDGRLQSETNTYLHVRHHTDLILSHSFSRV